MKALNNLKRKAHKTKICLKRASPTILSCLATVGVVATAVVAVKATPKALRLLEEAKKEKGDELSKVECIIAAGSVYVPAAAIGISAIICIFGANTLNRKQQASIASAYMMLHNYHKEYRDKLVEMYGKDMDVQIRNAMAREHCNYHQIELNVPDGKVIFYDELSGESFLRYEREVMDAEYHLNRNFVLRGYVSLNEFYEFLGLPKTHYGETMGWSSVDGYYWIDFEHRLISQDDGGTDVYVIDMIFPPDTDYLDGWQ